MNFFGAIQSFQLIRPFYFKTAPCYYSKLKFILLAFVLNNGQKFNFFDYN